MKLEIWREQPLELSYIFVVTLFGFGFEFVENYTTPDSMELPQHNRKLALTLLEYRLGRLP